MFAFKKTCILLCRMSHINAVSMRKDVTFIQGRRLFSIYGIPIEISCVSLDAKEERGDAAN